MLLNMSPELFALSYKASKVKMTPEQVYAQRVSFIYGQMGGKISKQHITNILERRK